MSRKGQKLGAIFLALILLCADICTIAEAVATLNLPSSLRIIDEQAFYGNTSIEKVIVPDGTTEIRSKAFAGSSLTEIELPGSLTFIAEDAFENCGTFKVIVPEDCYAYEWAVEKKLIIPAVETAPEEDFEYTVNADNTAMVTGYVGDGGDIVMPETLNGHTISMIGYYSFYECSSLTSIKISSGVTSVGVAAFRGCSNLSKIILPEGLTEIWDDAFSDCSLVSVHLPETVTSIGAYAFINCDLLESVYVPESVFFIGEDAFYGTPKLTVSVVAGGYAEEYCAVNGIKYDTYKSEYTPKDVFTINELDDGTVEITGYTWSNPDVVIPSYVGSKMVTRIGNRAFYECFDLTSITIPDGVTSIGDEAFACCSGLTSITIPEGVTSIGDEVFANCSGLTSITIPEGVTSIGDEAFAYCSGLTSITIPEGVTSIGDRAFLFCSGLTGITIPEGVTSIGNEAFIWCSGLTSITIPEGVTSIGEGAFTLCSSLTSITISEGVRFIEENTFSDCSGLTSIIIPNGVIAIKESAFYGCSSLTSIAIPGSVVSIGYGAFGYCSDELTIYGELGSEAETYAEENEIAFKSFSDWEDDGNGNFVPIQPECCSLSGYVTTQGGKGIENVYVLILENMDQGAVVANDTTDRNGYWSVDGLIPGMEYQVAYYHPEYAISSDFCLVERDTEISQMVELLAQENDVHLSFAMSRDGEEISEIVVGTAVDFTVYAPGASWVRFVADGMAYEEYQLDENGHAEFSRIFTEAGARQICFQAYQSGTYGNCSEAQLLKVTATDGSMNVETLPAPVVDEIGAQIVKSEFIVSWQPVENADGYNVYLYSGDLRLWQGSISSGDVCRIQIPTPQRAGIYTVVVMAYGYGYNQSEGSATVNVHDTAEMLEIANAAQLTENVLGGTARVELASFASGLYKKLLVTPPEGEAFQTEVSTGTTFFVDFTMCGTYAVQAQGCMQQDFAGEIYSTEPVYITIDADTHIGGVSHDGIIDSAGIHYDTQDMLITVEMNFVADNVKVYEGDATICESDVRNGWYAMDCVLPQNKLGAGIHELRIAAYYEGKEIDSEDYIVYIIDYVNDSAVYYLAEDACLWYLPSDNDGVWYSAGTPVRMFGTIGAWKYVCIGKSFGFVNAELVSEWNEALPTPEIDPERIEYLSGNMQAMRGIMNKGAVPIWFAPAQGDLTARVSSDVPLEFLNVNVIFTGIDKVNKIAATGIRFNDDGTVDVTVPAQLVEANGSGTYRFLLATGDKSPVEKGMVTVYEPIATPYAMYPTEEYLELYAYVCADAQRYYSEKTGESVFYEDTVMVCGKFGEYWNLVHYRKEGIDIYRWAPTHLLNAEIAEGRKRAFLIVSGHVMAKNPKNGYAALSKMRDLFETKGIRVCGEYKVSTTAHMDVALDEVIAKESRWYDTTYVYMFVHGAYQNKVPIPWVRLTEDDVIYQDEVILQKISKVKGKVVLIIESCYSGQFVDIAETLRTDQGAQLLPRDRYTIITSTLADEAAIMNLWYNEWSAPVYTLNLCEYCEKHDGVTLEDIKKNNEAIIRLVEDKTNAFRLQFICHMDSYGNDDTIIFE